MLSPDLVLIVNAENQGYEILQVDLTTYKKIFIRV